MPHERAVPTRSLPTIPTLVLAALLLGAPSSARAQDSTRTGPSAPADTARIVRQFAVVEVRESPLRSLHSEAQSRIGAEALRALPVDRPADALGLLPGVVLDGEAVHVRGGRPGELRIELDGIGLNEPFRGEAPELPLLAIDELELVRGGLEAQRGGGLAGTLIPRLHTAGTTWRSRVLWQTAWPGGSPDDRVGARVSGPVARTGIGVAVSGEARLDDASLPDLRTAQRTNVMGLSLGWRARNQLAASVRVAPVKDPDRIAVQAIVSRRLLRPFNPMFSLVGYTSPCPDPDCFQPPAFREAPDGGLNYSPYNAADHVPVTDIQRQTLVVSSRGKRGADSFGASLGWNRERRITSLDGNDDESAVRSARRAQFGFDIPGSVDPFHAWAGDVPFYRKSRAEWFEARLEWWHDARGGSGVGAGLGATHERVRLRQIDLAYDTAVYDSARAFAASVPGMYAWWSGRWAREGMVANAGLRAEWMTPGPDADATRHFGDPHGVWTVSPRFGASFPVGLRNALDVSYARIVQAPGREYLFDQRTGRVVPRHPLGNPELDPATAISFEVSLRRQLREDLLGRAGYFARDLYRQVSARRDPRVATAGSGTLRYASDDAGRAVGLEAGIEHEASGRLRWSLIYTWMRTEGSESFEDGVPVYPLQIPQPPPILETPLAWDQTHRAVFAARWLGRQLTVGWSSLFASGFPWTPAAIRLPPADLSRTHSKRLTSYTISDLSMRMASPRSWGGVAWGLEVRNVFDHRGARRVSIDGYPNPVINTAYDDYAAHLENTGLGGGAFWSDPEGDGTFGWTRVRDPRLDFAPRAVRLSIQRDW